MEQFPDYFDASVEDVDGRHVVTASGELDLASGPPLEQLLVETAGSTVVLDLSGLDFIDSVGIGTLIRSRRRITEGGNEIVFRGPLKAGVARIFQMTGLSELVTEP